jgi:hypothetical protein
MYYALKLDGPNYELQQCAYFLCTVSQREVYFYYYDRPSRHAKVRLKSVIDFAFISITTKVKETKLSRSTTISFETLHNVDRK